MKIIAIVLAAGKGKRMESSISKQFMMLCNKPVLYYSLAAFEDSRVDEIVIVTSEESIEFVKSDIVDKYQFSKVVNIVKGGAERYNSVYNGLKSIEEAGGSDIVLIHDGARPFIDNTIINAAIEDVLKYKTSIIAVPAKDTIKVIDKEGFVESTPNRKTLWQIQTPQSFDFKLILEAYEYVIQSENKDITDDSMVLELYKPEIKIKITQGKYENIKLTTPEDMRVGESLITHRL